RPAVAPVRISVELRAVQTLLGERQQLVHRLPASLRLLQAGNHVWQCGTSSGPRRGVLLEDEALRLSRPGHQLAVEDDPVRVELGPEASRRHGLAHFIDEGCLQLVVGEEAPSHPRVADPGAVTGDAEAAGGDLLVAADDHHGARAHVLLLADYLADAA